MLAENIRYYRKKLNMSLSELSEKTGVSISALSETETGKRTYHSEERLKAVADALGVSISQLWEERRHGT